MKKIIFFILLLEGLAASCATSHAGRLQYIELYSRDCNICNRMAPVLEAATAEYGDSVDIQSYGTSMDTGEELEKKYNVKKFPANLFIGADGMVFFRYEGLLDQKSVEEILDRKIKASAVTRTVK